MTTLSVLPPAGPFPAIASPVLRLSAGVVDSLDALLDTFMTRRFARCKMVVDASAQVSAWEKTPDAPGADPVGVLSRANAALAAPI